MARTKGCAFTVRGRLRFPTDMLRYDACYPADTESATKVALSFDYAAMKDQGEELVIHLYSAVVPAPTDGRWASFGWHVISRSQRY
jgi:hypothetical protein